MQDASLGSTTRWPLTGIDTSIPPIYVRAAYLLRNHLPLEVIQQRWQTLLGVYPHLNGRINRSGKSIETTEGMTAPFQVCREASILIQDLEARAFHPALLPDHLFLGGVLASETGESALMLKLNLLQDGLVCGVTMHHYAGDGQALASIMKYLLDLESTVPIRQTLLFKDDPKRAFPCYRASDSPLGWQAPKRKTRRMMFHFDPASLASLKSLTSGTGTLHQVISCLVWSSVTRARRKDTVYAAAPAVSKLLYAIDARKQVGIPSNYLGNLALPVSISLPVAMIMTRSLRELSNAIRDMVNSMITPDYLAANIAWLLRPDVNVVRDYDPCWGNDVTLSNWSRFAMNVNASAIRWCGVLTDGSSFILPSIRPREEEGLYLYMGLVSEHCDYLLQDDTWNMYARLIEP